MEHLSILKKDTTFKKILIIDDDRTSNTFLSKIANVTKLSQEIYTIDSPIEAADYLALMEEKEIPDALFIDIEMPMINGWEILNTIEKNADLNASKIFMMTNSMDPKHEKLANKHERVSQFLQKPLGINMIKYLVHKH